MATSPPDLALNAEEEQVRIGAFVDWAEFWSGLFEVDFIED